MQVLLWREGVDAMIRDVGRITVSRAPRHRVDKLRLRGGSTPLLQISLMFLNEITARDKAGTNEDEHRSKDNKRQADVQPPIEANPNPIISIPKYVAR